MNLLPTPSTPAQITAKRIDQNHTAAFNTLKTTVIQGFNDIWHNKQATPQQVLNEFGTKGAVLFANHEAAVQLILSIDPTALKASEYIPPLPYTINSDGTVTTVQVPSLSGSSAIPLSSGKVN